MSKNRSADDDFIIIPPSQPLTKYAPQIAPQSVISPKVPKPSKRPSLKPKGKDTNVSTIDELEALIRNAKPVHVDDRLPPEPITYPETPTDDIPHQLDIIIPEQRYTDGYQRLFEQDGTLSVLKMDVNTETIDATPSTAQAVSMIFTYPANLPQQSNPAYTILLSSLNLRVQSSGYERGTLECVFIMHDDQIIAEWDQAEIYQSIAKKYDGDSKIRVEYMDGDNAIANISLPLFYSWATNGCSIPFINDGSFVMLVKWSDSAVNTRYSLHATMSICNAPRLPKTVDCKRLLYLGSSAKLPFEFRTDCFVHDVFVKCDNKIEYLGLYKDGLCLHGKSLETKCAIKEYEDDERDDIYQLSFSINEWKAVNLNGCNLGLMSIDLKSDEEDIHYDVFAVVENAFTMC